MTIAFNTNVYDESGRLIDNRRHYIHDNKVFVVCAAPELLKEIEWDDMKPATTQVVIDPIVSTIIAANPEKVEQAKDNPEMVSWFVAQVMVVSHGKADPIKVAEIIKQKLGIENERL